ncbi:MAG: DUF2490 domain-containing protein [Candidatus Melainabacteria bacterium]|nr:MAG: DUF2490 domain-containing protein [Candidatus Melainabacteria bacterium]
MPAWRKILLALMLASTYMFGAAAPSFANVEHDLQLWTPVTFDARIYRNLRGYLEVNPRIGDNITQMNQLLIRPALQYKVNEGCSLFAGYLWGTTYQNGDVLHENRLWEQVLFDKDIKRLSIINRTRLEQRMFPHLADTGNRLRHMLKLEYDLNPKLYLVASDELFINLNSVKNGPQGGIDQNRIFAGVGVRPIPKTRVEIGYQFQYINRTDQFDIGNHAIMVQTFIGIKD